jgi:acyl-CoA hydrolase/GNAT superfamily N-acetyltransferase
MATSPDSDWRARIVEPKTVIDAIRPGMRIFLSSGVAEPRRMTQHLMTASTGALEDIELIQLLSLGTVPVPDPALCPPFRLKTFFADWVADAAIAEGRVDFIPSRFTRIPYLIESGLVPVDMAIVQVTPPNKDGYCSLGVALDVAREAMEHAAIAVGEINPRIPHTFGDTYVPVAEFDLLVYSDWSPPLFDRWPFDDTLDRLAANVAALIEDGSCLAFSIGPFYEALAKNLAVKRNLGVHSPFFTDALMELMRSGAANNRRKGTYRGKALTSYAMGTQTLMDWLDHNPLVEFQRIDKVFSPEIIGRNPNFVTVIPAHQVDLYGRVGLRLGRKHLMSGPAEVMDFFSGAERSAGGRTIFALTSRDPEGRGNIRVSIADHPALFGRYESVQTVVTEHGVAYLEGHTIRERAQSLIDIAHPDDRADLVARAKAANILYPDQIFLAESARLYPADVATTQSFRNGLKVHFRAIKPSDEEEMRRLFYRFSNETIYYRYFGSIGAMPHAKMQAYVNVDWTQVMSVVGVVGTPPESGRIITEARFIRIPGSASAEVVFVVDEAYQGLGIATFLYRLLIRLARERGIKAFTADVLFSNTAMMKVFRKGELPVKAVLESGVYHLTVALKKP